VQIRAASTPDVGVRVKQSEPFRFMPLGNCPGAIGLLLFAPKYVEVFEPFQ
jgi:hypothetical protein